MSVAPDSIRSLVRHTQTPCAAARSIDVAIAQDGPRALLLRYTVHGDIARLRLPSPQSPAPADRLWVHTCCEAFVARRDAAAYQEWNFSPSGQWAQIDFSDYRERGVPAQAVAPLLQINDDAQTLRVAARIEIPPALGDALQIGLSVVIEDAQGTISYWALRHAPGKPDFHHRDTFTLALDLAPAISKGKTA